MKIKPALLREALTRNTPALLFDYEAIEANFKRFRKLTSDSGATWSMAVKALSRPEVMDVAKTYVDGFDISNKDEWRKIQSSVEPHHKIWLTNANFAELDFFIKTVDAKNLLVTVNDQHDLKIIKTKNVPYLIRIATSDLIRQAGSSRFGFLTKDISPDLMNDPNFRGFHIHQGLEDNSAPILEKILSAIKDKFKSFTGKNLVFNLGGSFQQFSDSEITSALNSLKGMFNVHIEPGRALFKEAGFALAPIEKFIVEGDELRLFTRLSFIGHLKWSKPGFAGILNLGSELETVKVKTIVLEGPTCYEFDKSEPIKVDAELAFTKGSLVVLDNITGYSAEWNTAFNGVPACEVKFVGRRRPDSP